jgi:hypothetical protein
MLQFRVFPSAGTGSAPFFCLPTIAVPAANQTQKPKIASPMKRPRSTFVLTVLSFAVVLAVLTGEVCADVTILTERNDNKQATPEFKFRTIPPVSKDDIGGRALFSAIEGERDTSSGDLDKLSDGALPKKIWDMGSHFFFRTGSSGGAILMDLGAVTDLQQVNTYSWHSSTRGPQVYQLFAHDGQGDGFNSRPAKGADLEKAGWKLVAKVDTRAEGKPGGQYGVSITDTTGSLGKFRFLIFKMERTESADPYGNTFYSEIDVIGRRAPEAAKVRTYRLRGVN